MDIIKSKNKILTIIMVILCVVIAIGVMTLVNQNTLHQTTTKYTHEAGEELFLHAGDFFDADEEQATQILFDTSGVDVNTVGEYEAVATFKDETFQIKVSVVDTTAPKAEFAHRYVFTNDMENTSFEGTFTSVADASEWSAQLVRFEHKENLQVMDENGLKRLTDTIPSPADEVELKAIGTTDIPTEEGIYRAVVEIADVHGNTALEEVYVIYDATGARIDDTPDKTIEAAEEDLDKEPEVDKTDYIITDNVDGVIDAEDISCELELRDAEKHEWLVHVSYTDRAGNESKAEFLIIVKEERTDNENEDGGNKNETPSNPDKNNTNNNDNTSNSDTPADEGTTVNNGDSVDNGTTSNNDGGNTNTAPSDDKEYDPADTNKDGVVDGEEAAAYINPYEQMVIDAGYGNVVDFGDGEYAVLTHGDGTANGKNGGDILRGYLKEKGLAPTSVSGSWIRSANDWYCYTANNVHEIDTSGLEWTGDGTVEFIE